MPLHEVSGRELARRIREREASARVVCEAHIAAIRRVNPVLNAVVATRFDDALAEADAVDAQVKRGDALPPYAGVPCTIKESFAVTGMPQSSGPWARRHVRATEDAPTVARLRAAGAIVLGVTNVSELCMWMESNNRVYGRSNNPYDPTRIVGGSSGGEGAIVGAGASPFGLGADVGGSIRMPAFFNGVFGHKPSAGLVPNRGQYPVTEGEGLKLLSTGPLCRRAEDLYPLLEVLAGPDPEDPGTRELPLRDPSSVDLSKLRVLVVDGDGVSRVSAELVSAQRRVADVLARRGARVRHERIGALKRTLEVWSAAMSAAADTRFAELLGNGRRVRAGRELGRWLLGRSPHTLPAIALALLEGWADKLEEHQRHMLAMGGELRGELTDRIGEDGIMLYPPYPTAAPRHFMPMLPPIRWAYTALFNVMHFPVTQVPLGLGPQGLPLGVQVASVHGNDHVTIAVAEELERALGGWVVPKARAR